MLAEQVKIQTILKQRQFIEKQLSQLQTREDGNPSYSYLGYIYPENIQYFNKLGFTIHNLESENLRVSTCAFAMYIFFPAEYIKLSPKNMKEAEKYQKPEIMSDREIEEKLKENVGLYRVAIIGPEDYE